MASTEEAQTAAPTLPVPGYKVQSKQYRARSQRDSGSNPDRVLTRVSASSPVNKYTGLALTQKLFYFMKGMRLGIRTHMSKSGFTWDKNVRD